MFQRTLTEIEIEKQIAQVAKQFCRGKCLNYAVKGQCIGSALMLQRRISPSYDFPLKVDDVAKCIKKHIRKLRKLRKNIRLKIMSERTKLHRKRGDFVGEIYHKTII